MNDNVMNGMYTFKGVDKEFSFRTDINATDKLRFVNTVTEYVVGENYNSIIRNLMFDYEIIDIFTDIDLTDIRDAVDSLNKIDELVSETKIVKIVKENMVDNLLIELNNAVDDNIAYKTGVNRNSFTDALSHLLQTIDKKIDSIDVVDLMNVAKKLGNISGKLTPDKILEAYADSDSYKSQVDITEQNREQRKTFINKVINNVKK